MRGAIREWLMRLHDWVRRDRLERELREELRFHQQQLERDAVATGVPGEVARSVARRRLGNVTRVLEDARERWSLPPLDRLWQDVRHASRGLRRAPGFTLTAVFTLALGIGANAAMFGIVDRLMFRPYPYLHDPGTVHRIYLTETRNFEKRIRPGGIEYTRYQDLARFTTSFSEVAAFAHPMVAIGAGESVRERRVAAVSGTFWSMFRARPVLGRFFTPAEDVTPEGAAVAVLGYDFWQSEFGGRDVIGESLPMGAMSPVIVGIAPPGFTGVFDYEPPAVYIPVTYYAATAGGPDDRVSYHTSYYWGWLSVMARRKPGVTREAASTDASQAYWRSWEAERSLEPGLAPAASAQPAAIVSALKTPGGPDPTLEARTALWLLGVAVIVLLIACANVANLFLARAIQRQRETAVRLALGISRRRLVQQMLLESLLLCLLGSIAALVIAQWGGAAIRHMLVDTQTQPISVFTDGRTIAVVFGVAVVAALLTGLTAAFFSSRRDLAGMLKSGVREGMVARSRMHSVLLIAQAALSVVLLVGAALFVRSLDHVRDLRMGYDAANTLIVRRNLAGVTLDSAELVAQREVLLSTARGIPGVASVAWASSVPFWSTGSTALFVPGVDSVARLGQFTYQLTTPDYFRVMGTRLVRGRGFTSADRAGAPRVAVVSESMARTLWPGTEAIGRCFRMRADTLPCIAVIGIAEDIVQREIQLSEALRLHYYLPIDQAGPQNGSYLLVRTDDNAANHQEAVRRALQPIMTGRSYITVRLLSDAVEGARRSWRLGATLFVAFGTLALAVAAIGLYGVIAYNVTQRRHELGVRVALGARRGSLVAMVLLQSARFGLIGLLIGYAVAYALAPAIEPLLFRQSARDPAIYSGIGLIMLTVALLASAVPALRATRADPNSALRGD